jgi:signal transduction histidine kinase
MGKKLNKLRDNYIGDVSSRQYLNVPYLVFAVAILLTVGTTYLFYKSAEANDRARFTNDITKVKATIQSRLDAYVTLLKSGRGFVEASKSEGKEVTKDSFAVFIKSLELEEGFQGAQGIGFIKRVQPGEQPALAEKMKAEGHKEFSIFPAEAAEKEGYVILYLEPLNKDRNKFGIGYVISNEPPKWAAIEKAAVTGDLAVSEKLNLFQLPRNPNDQGIVGFQLYVPIYRSGQVPETEQQRREELESLLYCPFRAYKFIEEIQKAGGVSDISFAIYDQKVDPDHLLGESQRENKNIETSSLTQSLSRTIYDSVRFEETTETKVGNETWFVKYRSLPAFHSNSATGWTIVIFFFGLGISLILFFITLSQSKAHTSLEAIAKDLARSERVKDEFIAVVSHELRTPLNSIAGGVTIMRNRNVTSDTREKALDIIEKNLRSQANLVEDMIVFSDINAGKGDLHLQPLSFSMLVNRVFNEFSSQAKLKDISFTKEDVSGGKTVAGDEPKLEKVLQSVLSNALKFTSSKGEIAMEVSSFDHVVELKIKDNGFGIHPQILPHIFELFKQGDSSLVRRHGGLGLGMTLSRHIVKLHGGTLEAESGGLDKGSTFILRLPVIENKV